MCRGGNTPGKQTFFLSPSHSSLSSPLKNGTDGPGNLKSSTVHGVGVAAAGGEKWCAYCTGKLLLPVEADLIFIYQVQTFGCH